jgi:fatty acid amide hydrolase
MSKRQHAPPAKSQWVLTSGQQGREGETRSDFIHPSASELARRIAAGELSSREVVEAHIRRIEAVNPDLNAVVVPLFEQAREEALKADHAHEQGALPGPLHGVPITLKEQFLVAGTASTVGLISQQARYTGPEGPLVQRLRQAGAIILGKTHVAQLLMYHEATHPVYGRTSNPWDLARTGPAE